MIIAIVNLSQLYIQIYLSKSWSEKLAFLTGLVTVPTNVWFQKISIPPPRRELEIPEGWGGSMAQEIPEGRRGEWWDKFPEGQLHIRVRHNC